MNAPAAQKKRFSLTRLLGDAPPAAPAAAELAAPPAPHVSAPTLPPAPEARPAHVLEALPPVTERPAASADASAPAAAPPAVEPSARKPRAEKKLASDERHSKKKRSYSVDMGVCDDLEVLAWYQGKSSSAVVEELLRQYLGRNRQLLEKAITVRNGRKDEAK